MVMSSITSVSAQNVFMPNKTFVKEDDKVSFLMRKVVEVKNEKKQDIEKKRSTLSGRYLSLSPDSDGILVFGDLFSMGFLGFQAVQNFFPSIISSTLIKITGILGMIGGVINVFVGIICVVQGIKKVGKQGQGYNAARLLIDGVLMIAIGGVMIFSLFSSVIVVTCPYLLPLLFALLSVFITFEVGKYVVPMFLGKDLGTRFMREMRNMQQCTVLDQQEKKVSGIVEKFFSIKDGKDSYSINTLQNETDQRMWELLCKKMDQLEGEIGTEAAIALYNLMLQLVKASTTTDDGEFGSIINNLVEERDKLDSLFTKWRWIQYTRFAQQVLYIVASVASWATFIRGWPVDIINGCVNFFMTLANFIPLVLDITCPFERNVPVVVGKVTANDYPEEAIRAMQKASQLQADIVAAA